MMKDVPHAKTIFGLGLGGLIFGVVMLTWVYPLFCSRVEEVKDTKVREYMEDRYGISDRSGEPVSANRIREELRKTDGDDDHPATSPNIEAGDMADHTPSPEEDASVAESDESEDALPPAKRH